MPTDPETSSPSVQFSSLRNPVPNTPATHTQATRHWGSIRSVEGTPSPMFTRLCIAIFNHFDASVAPANTNLMEPSKLTAIEKLMGITGDGDAVFSIQKGIIDGGGTMDDADDLLRTYWTTAGIAHVMTTRESANPVWHGTPALTVESFEASQFVTLEGDPRRYWWELKRLVDGVPGLVDPVTGKVFQYPMIPWSCFPQEPIPETVAKLITINEKVLSAATAWGQKLGVELVRRKEELVRREEEQRNIGQNNIAQSNIAQSNADALAIMAQGQQQQMQLNVMGMMHSQRMMALSNAYGYNSYNYY